jgi:hypothetical protein
MLPLLETSGPTVAPAFRLLLDWYLEASFPITWPANLSAEPIRTTTRDMPDAIPELGGPYEGLLAGEPTLAWIPTNAADGTPGLEAITATLLNGDGRFDVLLDGEVRGKIVVAHLYDERTHAYLPRAFTGQIAKAADDASARTVTVAIVAADLAARLVPVPRLRHTADAFPYAPPSGLGTVATFGAGVGVGLPCRPIRTRDDRGTLVAKTLTAAPPATCTIPAHGLTTGDGPYQVRTTDGDPPAGVAADAPYWITVLDADTLQLASSPANAALGIPVAFTTAGTGTSALVGGRAPQLAAEYDFDVGVGNYALDRVAPSGALFSYQAGEYELLPRTYRPDGRYLTVVRLRRPNADASGERALTADVQRLPDMDDAVLAEWDFKNDFRDRLGRFHAIPGGWPGIPTTLTDADRVAGFSRVGLGAVALNGVDGYLTVPGSEIWRLDEWTLDLQFVVPASAAGLGKVLGYALGPGGGRAGAGSSWLCGVWAPASGIPTLALEPNGILHVPTAAAPPAVRAPLTLDRWHFATITYTRDAGGTVVLYLDGAFIAGDDGQGPISYGPPGAPLAFGLPYLPLLAARAFGRGRLGWTRLSATVRDRAYHREAWGIMRRSPLAFARTFWRGECGRACVGPSFDAAQDTLDAIEDGSVKCDVYVTVPTTGQAVQEALAVFYNLHFPTAPDGRIEAAVDAPATAAVAHYGHGPGTPNNLVAYARERASIVDAIRVRNVVYRPIRDDTGTALAGYRYPIAVPILPVGQEGKDFPLQCVYDHTTAALLAGWLGYEWRRRDKPVALTLGVDGAARRPGDVVRINIPARHILGDYQLPALTLQGRLFGTTALPYDPAGFTIAPRPLLVDAITDTSAALFLGVTPAIVVTNPTPATRGVSIAIELRSVETLAPIGNGTVQQFEGAFWPGGPAPSHWQVLALLYGGVGQPNGFLATASVALAVHYETARLAAPVKCAPGMRVREVRILHWLTAGAGTATLWPLIIGTDGARLLGTAAALGSAWALYQNVWPINPATGLAWTPDALTALEVGVFVLQDTANSVGLAALSAVVTYLNEAPRDFGFVRVYRQGPSPTQPAPPTDADEPIGTFPGLDGIQDTAPGSGRWWYSARPYDRLGRAVGLIGPASVTFA